ncbi:MAG: HD domain-containing protein [Clostridia bacterium]|nr:HD domain-containing protein [Clostridia bacterium]
MDFYASAVVLTELMMLTMIIHVLSYSGFSRQQKSWYILTFVSIMLCCGSEFAVHGISYNTSLAPLLTVLTVIQFSLAPVLGVLFTGALGLHNQVKIAGIFFALSSLVEIVAAPFKLVFYFDESGYHRGSYFLIYGFFYFASLIYLLIGMIIVGRKFSHRDIFTIGMVLVVLIAGIIPMTFYRVNITYIAVAIGACICYIYYNDLVQQDIKSELIRNQKKISDMQLHMISGMANLIENRDMETGGHIFRTSNYVKTLSLEARREGVYTEEIDDHFVSLMETLAPMHDIGKIVISDAILRKPGKLTKEEYEAMKKHASAGGAVVREVLSGVTDEEYMTVASDIATYHHEWWDGTGYPKGLKGDEIPLAARIMAIADVFDALVSERCYKKAMPPEAAFEVIKEESGSHFDPKLVEVFLNNREEFKRISM